jgi:hypothetical protein
VSRSNNTDVKNPAAKFFQWSGDEGKIKSYNKETKETTFSEIPFTFLVLDRLITIAGYSDDDKSGFWSNEIRNTKTEVLTVRTKAGIRKTGLYEDVKTLVGAKFAQSLYIAFFDEDKQLKIGNFKLVGCAVSAWIEFCKSNDIYKGAVRIVGTEEGQKGKTTYFSPVFQMQEAIKPETESTAIRLDEELQTYLKSYFAMRGQAAAAGADNLTGQEYIDARDREINRDYPAEELPEFSGDGSVDEEIEIPF